MHPEPPPISEADEAELAALADGRLDTGRERVLFERLGTEPALAEAYERQQRGLAAITAAAADVSAPLALHARIADMEHEAVKPRPRRLRRPRLAIALPAFALAAAAVLAILVTGRGPTVDSVLAAATRPPLAAATPGLAVDGVRFPASGAWQAEGTRADKIRGRRTRTVTYTRDGRRLTYTIVAGAPLTGAELRGFTRDGRAVVTWRRQGHTCVLSSGDASPETLQRLASWR